MTGSSDGNDVVYTAATTGKDATVVVKGVEAKGQKDGLDNTENLPIPAASQTALKTAMGGNAGKYDLTFTYDADGLKSVSATPASK